MTVGLYLGDCLDVMAEMPENSVDSVITDPPYGIFFMSANWDHGVPGEAFWKEALRVAKPGAMLMAFGGTRTHHRLMVTIEDAGWILRDTMMWVYGSGFPKSHDISKAIDKAAGMEREVIGHKGGRYDYAFTATTGAPLGNISPRENSPQNMEASGYITAPATDLARTWDGWGTALKPAWEIIILAMAPLDGTFAQNAEKWGVAGLWIDGARVESGGEIIVTHEVPKQDYGGQNPRPWHSNPPPAIANPRTSRFPANLIHDGSDEVVGLFPVTKSGNVSARNREPAGEQGNCYGFSDYANRYKSGVHFGDSGSAARFFYCAKASRKERNAGLEGMEEREHHSTQRTEILVCQCGNKTLGNTWPSCPKCGADMRNGTRKQRRGLKAQNHHPTVKPLALMEYLCKLTRTPTGGIVLDPFMGSGTTGIACIKTDRDFVGIELDPDYFEIAEARIAAAKAEPVQAEMPMGGGN